MKEAYRLNKTVFYEKLNGKYLHLAFIYTGKTAEKYDVIATAVKALTGKIAAKP